MSLSLYSIEASLLELVRLREDAEAEGDSEALKVIDGQIRAYLTAEAAKVTSYVGLIRTKTLEAQACEEEAVRFSDMAKRRRADIDRLKTLALEVMQRFNVKELKATPGGGLRRQANGGVQALQTDGCCLPDQYLRVTASLPMHVWDFVKRAYPAESGIRNSIPEPDQERIREALKKRVVCPECLGHPVTVINLGHHVCARCKDEGTIPNTIPGVKLLPRGEQVRVI